MAQAIAAVAVVGILVVLGVSLLAAIAEGVQSHARDRYRAIERQHHDPPPELLEQPLPN